jgi:Zn-dependent M28 family amino/carboxypeptidase
MLRQDVEMLATTIGPRYVSRPRSLRAAAGYLEKRLREAGYAPTRQGFDVNGVLCENVVAELPGTARPDEIVVVGGHYDTVQFCPGANDNTSGTAATLALAEQFAGRPQPRTMRFVLFVNEEPPYYHTEEMGSLVYARSCQERGDDIKAMISLETIGCYFDKPDTQSYPLLVGLAYPSTGNFIAFVGNLRSRRLVHDTIGTFRENAMLPSEGGAIPGWITGIGWSDHWSFWQAGYPAVMVTDTAPFRYKHYHKPTDTAEKLDYDRMAILVEGMIAVLEKLGS